MNLPFYATALIVFAVAFLQVGTYLLIALDLALAGMAIVLLVQLALARAKASTRLKRDLDDSDRIEALRRARASEQGEASITGIFVVVTWGIFAWLRKPGVQLLGPGLTYSQVGGPAASSSELAVVIVGLAILGVAVVVLSRLHYNARVESKVESFRPLMVEPVPVGSDVSCQFVQAYRYAIAPESPPSSDQPDSHSGDLQFFTLLGLSGGLTERFAICRQHARVFARVEAFGRIVIARR